MTKEKYREVVGNTNLCIYPIAEACLLIDAQHPIMPLLWQLFFVLYFSRCPDENAVERFYGHKLINTKMHSVLFEDIRKRLFYLKQTLGQIRNDTIQRGNLCKSMYQWFDFNLERADMTPELFLNQVEDESGMVNDLISIESELITYAMKNIIVTIVPKCGINILILH